MRFLKQRWPFLLAALSGVLLAIGYAPYNVEHLVWFALLPLMFALWYGNPVKPEKKRRRMWWGAGLGYATGLLYFGISISWIQTVHVSGWVALGLYLALYPAVWGAFVATLGRPRDALLSSKAITKQAPGMPSSKWDILLKGSSHALRIAFCNAGIWAGLELLRGWVFSGFGWNGLGVALVENLLVIQIADIVGVTGLSFIVCFCSSIIATTIRRIVLQVGSFRLRPHFDAMVAFTLVMGCVLYGVNRTSLDRGEKVPLRLLLIQRNVPQNLKWDDEFKMNIYRGYDQFTTTYVESQKIDLVIWPETAIPGLLQHGFNQNYLEGLMRKGNFSLLLGIQEGEAPSGNFFNSAALLQEGVDDLETYRKLHLVPFGEFIPFRHPANPLVWIAGGLIAFDFNRGTSTDSLELKEPNIKIATLICFEDTVGRLARKFVRPGPQIFVNLTNDGWFEESAASHQHLANARFRSIELRRPLIRSANTGVSCVIDSVGSLYNRDAGDRFPRVIADPETGNTFIEGTLPITLQVPAHPPKTFYASFGDLFTIVVFVLAVLPAAVGRLKAKTRVE